MRTGSRAALALALCAGACAAALTGCGDRTPDGYAAVGAAAAGPERGPGENVAPGTGVEYQPLPPSGPASSSVSSSTSTPPGAPGSPAPGSSAQGGATTTPPGGSAPAPGTPQDPAAPPDRGGTGGAGSGSGGGAGSGSGSGSGGTGSSGGGSGGGTPPTQPGTPTRPGTPTAPGTTPPAPPATPARIALSSPARAAASDRWCERVTVTFTNTGSTAARSVTVSFATHIIGALGIDWATITTTQALPAPVAGGTSKTQTYTVCVESWRVPLGMHVETRNVSATWS
ncbi:hypothetical protein OOK31_21185 [Streptomyces sp. NBC_00249]|uniref:hypothetical protein n=1 Tax=Streptomyces sp. NBC_00249 TaxID=2975690 RepID=UPI0022577C20|nr:hypothetical protein [Streptomyces sp. NBC_00249]MCX5196380.1 hypothetical protein [Streptomyces sp. NBC_00249]